MKKEDDGTKIITLCKLSGFGNRVKADKSVDEGDFDEGFLVNRLDTRPPIVYLNDSDTE